MENSCVQIAIYDNRVEITSPGMLYGGLIMEQAISGRSKIRNVCIAEVFSRMGIIEQWGTGFQRMIRGCKEYGVREPEFIDMGDAFRVNFYRSNIETGIETSIESIKTSTESRMTGIENIETGAEITQDKIAEILGMSKNGIRYVMNKLKSRGILVRVGATKKGRWPINL